MAMSLDYMGKMAIMMIVIAVSIGMIVEFRGQIEETAPDPNPNEQEPGLEIVQINKANSLTKVSDLITLCHQRSLEQGYKDFSCFVARTNTGSFNLESTEIENKLKQETADATDFKASTYDRDSIIIEYNVKTEKVSVKK